MSSVPPEALELPTKALADELVQAYFTYINRGFPIVDEDFFMMKYSNTDAETDIVRPRPLSLLLLNAILLVGAHVLSPQREDVKAMKPVFFKRAKALFDCRFEQHRETYLQAAILLTWQCDDLEDVISNSWHWVGVAVRTAFGMGMHRDNTPSNLNIMDKRLWTRLWWTLFQFDVLVSMAHGRPQAINLEDSDVPMLEEHHFDNAPDAEATFTIQHTQLCIIFSKAMRKRAALRSTAEDRAKATREADVALAGLITNLPERLQLSHGETDAWQSMFHLTYNSFLILLHRSSPRPVPGNSPTEASNDLSICSDAAATISSIFEYLRNRDMLCRLWLPSIHVLFTALVHTSSQMHSANPIVAAKSKRHSDSMIQTLHSLKGQWLYAQSLLNLFEPRSSDDRNRQQKYRLGDLDKEKSAEREHSARYRSGSRFSLPPEHIRFDNCTVEGSSAEAGGDNLGRPLSSGPAYISQTSLPGAGQDFARSQGEQYQVDLTRDISQDGQIYGPGFGDALGLTDTDHMDMLPLPSALEFLLAGAGNNFDF
ncbi:hypothetical protein EsH8_III_000335 [Colletotrichum jinshuiense]